ncbi:MULTISPECIES: hypothetical protein [unclassified Butyrivibrio]|uniref:hypothetical protein n=1 Tax=unclassified Butyrivibrio TaxID=2639466 RepID=UPI00041295DC|nr:MULTISPECIES: hypothetical protein [unclassified Butyrivibrio]SEK43550.1 hypothetical protein SAMN04487770_101398 [Butyrivibrio sp. ob235]
MSAEEITEEKIVEASEEKPEEKKKERKFHKETRVITEAPKTRLITAFVMLLGGGFMAIFTLLQHYEIGAWIKTLLLSLAVFFVVGRFFELIVSHFDNLNRAKEDAILVQEEAIAQREADELAAAEAEAQAEAERLAAEEAAALADEETENQNTPNEYNPFGESDDFVVGEDFSEF